MEQKPKYKKGDKFIIGIIGEAKYIKGNRLIYPVIDHEGDTVWLTEESLDSLELYYDDELPFEKELYQPYHGWHWLMDNRDNLTAEERERLKRVDQIPDEVREVLLMRLGEIRRQVIGLEATHDTLNDFLNGEDFSE